MIDGNGSSATVVVVACGVVVVAADELKVVEPEAAPLCELVEQPQAKTMTNAPTDRIALVRFTKLVSITSTDKAEARRRNHDISASDTRYSVRA